MLKETLEGIGDAFDSDDEAAFVDALSTLLRRRRNLDGLQRQHSVVARSVVARSVSPRSRRQSPRSRSASAHGDTPRASSHRKCREWLAEEITRHAWSEGLWPRAPASPPLPATAEAADPPPLQESDSCAPDACDPDSATPSKRAHAEDRHSACSSSIREDETDEDSSMRDKGYSSSAATEHHVFSMCSKKTPSPRKQKRKKHDLSSYEATLLRARKKLLQAREKKAKLLGEQSASTSATTTNTSATTMNTSTTNTINSSITSDPRSEGPRTLSTSKKSSVTTNDLSSLDTDSKPSQGKKEQSVSESPESQFEMNRKRILAHLAAKGSPWLNVKPTNKFTKLTMPMLAHFFPSAVPPLSCRVPVAVKEAPNKTATSVTTNAYNANRSRAALEEREIIHEMKGGGGGGCATPRMKEIAVSRGAMSTTKKSGGGGGGGGCEGGGDRLRTVPSRVVRPSAVVEDAPSPPVLNAAALRSSATQSNLHSRFGSSSFLSQSSSRPDTCPKVVALLPKQGRLRPFRPSSPKLPALFQKWARISGSSPGTAVASHANMWRRVAGTSVSYGMRADRSTRGKKPAGETAPMATAAAAAEYGLHCVPVYRPPARHGNRRSSPSGVHTH